MYSNLILYRNELKNKQVYKYKLIGIIAELIFSKKIFPKNKDIIIFLNDVFDITYKDYIIKSRTTIVAKVSKKINSEDNVSLYVRNLSYFIATKIDELKEQGNIIEKRNDFDGWIK